MPALKYRKKPIVIEAMQFDGENEGDIMRWAGTDVVRGPNGSLVTFTKEGPLNVSNYDYIIKGIKGEFYPCKPDIFQSTYDAAVEVEAGPTEQMHPAIVSVLAFFVYEHLPERLQAVSKPFAQLAHQVAHRSPNNPETTVALRKLLESKDCAVRAALQ